MARYVDSERKDSGLKTPERRTPLPTGQLTILLFLRFAESASAYVVFPFLNELISSVTGGDDAKVGYYAGIMESIRQGLSLVSVMYWSRLSDHIGRKPILLLGMFALSCSMASFGLSQTFWALVASRCIFTALNSNAGVIKSMVGDITDHTNSADAFALLHVPWAAGSSFGAFAGGWLARPQDRFPSAFPGAFWAEYPYFLPCAVMTFISVIGCLAMAVGLNETIKQGYLYKPTYKHSSSESEPLLTSSKTSEDPVPLKSLFQWKIMVPILNYVCATSLKSSSNAIQPLFLAMPVNIGGLGLQPHQVGIILGTYGIANSICQTVLLGRLVNKFGSRAIFVAAAFSFMPMFMFSPLMNFLVAKNGFSCFVWIMLACQVFCLVVTDLAYGCIYMFITAAAPNKRSLGATNGLAQTLASIGRIVTPAMASGLLSLSIERHILGGYAVYAMLIILSFGGVWLACQLPRKLH